MEVEETVISGIVHDMKLTRDQHDIQNSIPDLKECIGDLPKVEDV